MTGIDQEDLDVWPIFDGLYPKLAQHTGQMFLGSRNYCRIFWAQKLMSCRKPNLWSSFGWGNIIQLGARIIWQVWVLRSCTPVVGCGNLLVQILYMHGTCKENNLFSTYLIIASKIVVWPKIDHGIHRLGAIMHLLRRLKICNFRRNQEIWMRKQISSKKKNEGRR